MGVEGEMPEAGGAGERGRSKEAVEGEKREGKKTGREGGEKGRVITGAQRRSKHPRKTISPKP